LASQTCCAFRDDTDTRVNTNPVTIDMVLFIRKNFICFV
jgi:hypothetical protein